VTEQIPDAPPSASQAWPKTLAQVAEQWHCSTKWLSAFARMNNCGRLIGRKLIFFEEDYEQLKAALPGPSRSSPTWTAAPGSRSISPLRLQANLQKRMAKKPKKRRPPAPT